MVGKLSRRRFIRTRPYVPSDYRFDLANRSQPTLPNGRTPFQLGRIWAGPSLMHFSRSQLYRTVDRVPSVANIYIYMHPFEGEARKNHGNQWQRFHCGWIKTNSETARFSCAMLRLIRNITSENGVRARIPVTYSMSNTMRMQRTAFELVGEQKYE